MQVRTGLQSSRWSHPLQVAPQILLAVCLVNYHVPAVSGILSRVKQKESILLDSYSSSAEIQSSNACASHRICSRRQGLKRLCLHLPRLATPADQDL